MRTDKTDMGKNTAVVIYIRIYQECYTWDKYTKYKVSSVFQMLFTTWKKFKYIVTDRTFWMRKKTSWIFQINIRKCLIRWYQLLIIRIKKCIEGLKARLTSYFLCNNYSLFWVSIKRHIFPSYRQTYHYLT